MASLSVLAGVALSEAEAEIDINNSEIVGRNVTLSSAADADSEATVLSFYLAVAYGHSIPHSTVDIRGGSSIVTTDDLSISTDASSDLNIIATQNLVGTSTVVEKRNVTLAGAYSDVVSTAELSSDSTLTVGDDFVIDVFATREHNTQSNAAAYGDGTLGVALNVAVHESQVEALIDGDVTTGGDMTVEAELETLKNDFNATSTVGTGAIGGRAQRFTRVDRVGDAFGSAFGTGSVVTGASAGGSSGAEWARLLDGAGQGNHAQQTPNAFATSAAVNIGVSFNDVEVRIGEGADINVGGNLTLVGRVEEFPETSAISFLNSSNFQYAGSNEKTYSQRETGIAGALTGGYFQNEIDVYIGSGATVDVGGDLTIDSVATVPYHYQWAWDSRSDSTGTFQFSRITDKINYNLGIQNGFFTSWAEAVAGAEENAYGGMVNILLTDTHNYAYIGDNAIINVGGDFAINADTNVDTINFVGSPLALFNASAGRGIGAAAMAVGYLNDTTTKINQGAQINADSLLVFANNRGRTISIGLQGGLADGGNFNALSRVGNFNGAFTARFVDNRTVAKISPQANIELGDGQVAVPLSFRDVSQNDVSLISSVPMFDPFEQLNEDGSELRIDADNSVIRLPYEHGLTTGDPVIYDSRGNDEIGGLTSGETYYAIVLEDDEENTGLLQLSLTPGGDATPINLEGLDTSSPAFHSFYPGFDPSESGVVDTGNNQITLNFVHGMVSGQPVVYDNGNGTDIGGLTSGDTYYVVVTGPSSYKLTASAATAQKADIDGNSDDIIPLSSTGAGSGHSLRPISFDSAEVLDLIQGLDSNGDGDVTTADSFITGFNLQGDDGPMARTVQTNQSLLILAEDQNDAYSGTGAITKTTSSAASFSASVDVFKRQTEAFIGAEELPLGAEGLAPGTGIDSSGLIVLDYDHGFTVGDLVTYTAGGDKPIDGLRDRGIYVVTEVSGNTLRIGRSVSEPTAYFDAAAVDDSNGVWTVDLGYEHGFHAGDTVIYEHPDTDTSIGGLSNGSIYVVVLVDGQTIALAESISDVTDRSVIDFTPSLEVQDNTIQLGYDTGFEEGQPVAYRSNGGTPIGGLIDGGIYFVDLIDDDVNAIRLFPDDPDVFTSVPVELDASVATGTLHSFHAGFKSENIDADASGESGATGMQTINVAYQHGLETGDPVRYTTSGDAIGELTDDTRYYAIVIGDDPVALAATEDAANQGRQRYFLTHESLFDNGDATDADKYDTIWVHTEHGYTDGTQLLYIRGLGTDIGLVDGETYTVRLIDADTTTLTTDYLTGDDVHKTMIQLLDSNGDLVELTRASLVDNTPSDFIDISVRLDVTGAADSNDVHFLSSDARVELDASVATGSEHSFRLATSASVTTKAIHGFGRSFTGLGSTSNLSGDESDDTIDLGYAHGFSAGQAVVYSSGWGEPISGLSEGQVYYVRLVDGSDSMLQLATTAELALADTDDSDEPVDPEVVEFNSTESTGSNHTIAAVINPIVVADSASNTINFGELHGLTTGEKLVYQNGGGTSIGGLVNGQVYTVIVVSNKVIQLTTGSSSNDPIDLDATVATGGDHMFAEPSTGNIAQIIVGGNVGLVATNTGQIISVTLAGTAATSPQTNRLTGAGWSAQSASSSIAEKQSGGLNFSGTVAASVVRDVTRAYVRNADLVAVDLTAQANNTTRIYMGAGAATFASLSRDPKANQFNSPSSSSKGIAGALATNVIANLTEAFVLNSNIVLTGDLSVESDSSGEIVGFGISGAVVSGTLAAAGAIVVNVISQNVYSYVDDSLVQVDGDVYIQADNSAGAAAIAGALALTRASSDDNEQVSATSFGFGIAVNVISNDLRDGGTLAYIYDSLVDAGGDITVTASTIGATIGASLGFAINLNTRGSLVAAAAVNMGVNVVATRTRATIRGTRENEGIRADGDVDVSASDQSVVVGVVGAGAYAADGGGESTSSAVGAAIGVNVIVPEVTAEIDDTDLTANSISVDASADADIAMLGVAAAGAGDFAAAGQVTVNYIGQDITARISDAEVTATGVGGDVAVSANNDSTIRSASGAAALAADGAGSGNAIGAALAFNIIDDDTNALIERSIVTSNDGDISVDADSRGDMFTLTVGAAAGRQIAVGGSVSTIVTSNETIAKIVDSTVDADRNIHVRADQDNITNTISGAAGFSKQATGVGASLSISVIENTTESYIDNSTVFARANDSDTIKVQAWDADGEESTESISGLAVTASATDKFFLLSGTVGFGATGAAAINLAPTVLTSTTYAYVEDSDVNSATDTGGDVIVRSHQDSQFDTISGVAAGSLSGVSVGVAAQGMFVYNDTQSWISDTDTSDTTGNGRQEIHSGSDIEVSSNTRADLNVGILGVSLSKQFAGAGSIDFVLLNSDNTSTISDIDVFAAGDLTVNAVDNVSSIRGVGSVSGGVASVGGSVIVALNENTTTARMVDTHSNAGGLTSVDATSNASLGAIAFSGGVGVKGAFNIVFTSYVSNTETRAVIEGRGAQQVEVNQDPTYATAAQAVRVSATDNVGLAALQGSATGAIGGGAAGTVGIYSIQNAVDAHIGDFAIVSALSDVTVSAESIKTGAIAGGGLGLGGGTGFAGTVIVTNIGSGNASGNIGNDLDEDLFNAINDALDSVNDLTAIGDDETPSEVTNSIGAQTPGVAQPGTVDRNVQDVAAFIGESAVITVGGDLSVTATETLDYSLDAGSVALSAGLGFGAAVNWLTVGTVTEAFISEDAIVVVDGSVTVDASANETVDMDAVAAGGALLAVGAQYAEAVLDSDQVASIDRNVELSNATSIDVNAEHTRHVELIGTGAAIGGQLAVGFSGATAELGGTVRAQLNGSILGEVDDEGEVIGIVGDVTVSARSNVAKARTKAPALAGGLGIAVAGSVATSIIDTDVDARLGLGTEVYSTGTVEVSAATDHDAESIAVGQNGAVGVTIGVSDSDAIIEPTVDTIISSSTIINADSVFIESSHNVSQADGTEATGVANAEATSSGGAGLLGVQGSWANGEAAADVATTIGNATIIANAGDVTIESQSRNAATSDATGDSFAIIGVGLQTADVLISTDNQIEIESGATISSPTGEITINAHSIEFADTHARAGSGGLVGVSEARSDVDVRHETLVTVSDGVPLDAFESVTIAATAENDLTGETDALSGSAVAVPTARTDVTTRGQGTDNAVVKVDIGSATLRSDVITVTSDIVSADIKSDAHTQNSGLVADADAFSDLNFNADVSIDVASGANLKGEEVVSLSAGQSSITAESLADTSEGKRWRRNLCSFSASTR